MSESKRVFVDSSVLIAAAISAKGSARDLLLLALSGRVTVVVSGLVFEETERNLTEKFPAALPAFHLFRNAWEGATVDPDPNLVIQVHEIVAVKDAAIVAAAVTAAAEYLATYDRKHLLRRRDQIKDSFGVTVMTPDEILKVVP
jgi:predicted nucleic acid-binding protein